MADFDPEIILCIGPLWFATITPSDPASISSTSFRVAIIAAIVPSSRPEDNALSTIHRPLVSDSNIKVLKSKHPLAKRATNSP